jgi:hypothetical protein
MRMRHLPAIAEKGAVRHQVAQLKPAFSQKH